ncbi:MAG TPA: flagellar hook-basal body complex protein [Planctomycetota bacterium]|nr:flagellar hook-basal body complex protein [Planctomycetota bacterium]
MSLRALAIAATGSRALLQQIDLIAGNLSHATSVGYKRSRASFADLLDRSGVRLQSTSRMFDAGKLQATQRDLDLAVEGEGFLRVLLPDRSVAFTRAGNLSLDPDGNLSSADGYLVDPPIAVPPGYTKLTIDSTGLVQGVYPDADEPQELGQIELTKFQNPTGLESAGGTLFRATEAAGERIDGQPGQDFGAIRQGHLEQSNVDPLRELADLIQAQRAFELNNRVMQAADEILQSVNNLRRKS